MSFLISSNGLFSTKALSVIFIPLKDIGTNQVENVNVVPIIIVILCRIPPDKSRDV